MELLAQTLRDDDATGAIEGKTSIHIAIVKWVDPFVNAISRSIKSQKPRHHAGSLYLREYGGNLDS